ncbi:hypothetical protein ACVWXM_009610 [Bradyrhizobium sp. GM7.3]
MVLYRGLLAPLPLLDIKDKPSVLYKRNRSVVCQFDAVKSHVLPFVMLNSIHSRSERDVESA